MINFKNSNYTTERKAQLRLSKPILQFIFASFCLASTSVPAKTSSEAVNHLVNTEALNWKITKDKQGVTTAKADLSESDINLFRHSSVLTIKANDPFQTIIDLFGDGTSCPGWMKLCKNSQVVKTNPDNTVTIQAEINMPWPLSDRVTVSHKTLQRDAQSLTITLRPDYNTQAQSDLPRMISESQIHVSYMDAEEQYKIDWTLYSDPGGAVSTGMINRKVPQESREDFIQFLNALRDSEVKN